MTEEAPLMPPSTLANVRCLSESRLELCAHSSADGSGMTLCICCSQTSQPHICTCSRNTTCEYLDEEKPSEGNICTCEEILREVCSCTCLHSVKTDKNVRHVGENPCDTCICAEEYELEVEIEEEPCLSGRFRNVLDVQDRVQNYLLSRRVLELTDFMMRHLLVATPRRPIPFLIGLLDTCMYFRAGLKEPPLLFGELHLHAIVESFDPSDTGFLTAGQYRRAFQAVGVCNYPQPPSTRVSTALFSTTARQLLTHHLAATLAIDPIHKSSTCVCDDEP